MPVGVCIADVSLFSIGISPVSRKAPYTTRQQPRQEGNGVFFVIVLLKTIQGGIGNVYFTPTV